MICVKCNTHTDIISAEGWCVSCLLDSIHQSSPAPAEKSIEGRPAFLYEENALLEELGLLSLELKPL